jgi:hypothetical protein
MLSNDKEVVKMTKYLLLFPCMFVLASSAVAQTKTSGTCESGKADQSYVIQVPEREGSSYEILQGKSTWPKSFTVEGLESKENVGVEFHEVTGTSGRFTGTGFTRYVNGDKAYWRITGVFDQKTLTSSGKWTYTLGTGKLRGIKGSGTSACKLKSAESGGGATCEVEGEYTLPAAKK